MQDDSSVQIMVARIDERLKSVEEKLTSFIDEVRASKVSREEFLGHEERISKTERFIDWGVRLFLGIVVAAIIGFYLRTTYLTS